MTCRDNIYFLWEVSLPNQFQSICHGKGLAMIRSGTQCCVQAWKREDHYSDGGMQNVDCICNAVSLIAICNKEAPLFVRQRTLIMLTGDHRTSLASQSMISEDFIT